MSIARLALRLAAVEALCPYMLQVPPCNPGSTVWPTIAGTRVYDSRIELIQSDEQLALIEDKPILIVYTEEDSTGPYGTTKYPADEQIVHLAVEALIAARGKVLLDMSDGKPPQEYPAVTAHISSREHEALLDLLEGQVRRCIDTRNMAAGSSILNHVAMEIREVQSVPQRSVDREVWMAARTIHFQIKVKKEKWGQLPGSTIVPTGAPTIEWLPEPLKAVAKSLDPVSSAFTLCQMLAQQIARLQVEATPALAEIVVRAPDGAEDPRSDQTIASVQTETFPSP